MIAVKTHTSAFYLTGSHCMMISRLGKGLRIRAKAGRSMLMLTSFRTIQSFSDSFTISQECIKRK